MTLTDIGKWLIDNPGVLGVIAVAVFIGLMQFVKLTFYSWYVIAIAAALVIAAFGSGLLYFYAFLLGMITAFAEIIGKFRDEPLKSLKTPQAVLYHLLNGLIAVFALKVYFLNFGEGATEIDAFKAVSVAGFGSMLLMRSKFFNLKVGDEDISFGPEQIIKVFLNFMERAIDRVRAQSRVDFVREKLTNINFDAVQPYTDTMLNSAQTLGTKERDDLSTEIGKVSARAIDVQLKSYTLGFLLLDEMGEDFVGKLFDNPPVEWMIKAPVVTPEKKSGGLLDRLQFGTAPKEEKVFYLAYGSSMLTRRFSQRLGWSEQDLANFLESTMPQKCDIVGYTLAFNRLDEETMSGHANLARGDTPKCEGVLYYLTPEQLEFLDRSEIGYRRRKISVNVAGKTVEAQTYVANRTRDGLKPTTEYLQMVIEGAREHQLSQDYITRLEHTESASDARIVVTESDRRVDEKINALAGSNM